MDLRNNQVMFENWNNEIKETGIITGISKDNSKFILEHITDMFNGKNTSRRHKVKGGRKPSTLNTRRNKLLTIAKLSEKFGIKSIPQFQNKGTITEQGMNFWKSLANGTITKKDSTKYSIEDMFKVFSCSWKWYILKQAKKGIQIPDITNDIAQEVNTKKADVPCVYFTYEQLKEVFKFFNQDEQVLLLFLFDTLARPPSEAYSIKVNDCFDDFKQLKIRDEIAKGGIGRTIKLLLCSDALKEYVTRNKLSSNDTLFKFTDASYKMLNHKIKQVFVQQFGDTMTLLGLPYSKIRLYDFRHSGACHWRTGAYKSKIDALMYRGGWTSLHMLNYYTKRMGMKDTIEEEDLLITPDRNKMQKEIDKLKQAIDLLMKEKGFDQTDISKSFFKHKIGLTTKEQMEKELSD